MHVGRILNATRVLNAPADWEPARDGPCGTLPVRDEVTTAGRTMVSAWFPTPDEIARIAQGASIELYVVGVVHPPVSLRVGSPPHAGDT